MRFPLNFLLPLLMVASPSLFAGDLDKAFKYLNTGDYPNAQKYLREVLVEEPANAAANYGMAKYFAAKDNKDYNLDSANQYIKRAEDKVPFPVEDKQTKKFLALGVRDYTIEELKKSINFNAYSVAERENTLESYQHFLDLYTEKTYVDQATNFRNQKAYIKALSLKTPEALAEFIRKYPDAAEAKEAKERYEKIVYEQMTADKAFGSYKKYLDKYPNGAYYNEAKKNYEQGVFDYYVSKRDLAAYTEFEKNYPDHPAHNSIQDSIYKLATKAGTFASFSNFLRDYKNNRNYNDAWNQLYLLATYDATAEAYQKFLDDYPDYPDKERINKDLELSKRDLKPFKQGDKWGYAHQSGGDALSVVIPGEYEEAFEFKNGYAAVRSKPCTDDQCTYFYIDKNNKRVFASDFNFAGDFNNGFAIVGIGKCETEECKYGLIDRRGNYALQPVYEDIEDPSEGLYLAAKDDRYGFVNLKGEEVITMKYTNALPFSEGFTAVAIDSYWFFIDTLGRQKFLTVYRDASSFHEGLAAVTQDHENWGYVDGAGTFIIEPKFETAGDFENGFAIISKKEPDPRNKALTISQRYKIDKTGKVIEKLTAPKEPARKTGRKKGRK